jgi:hypothetical protein
MEVPTLPYWYGIDVSNPFKCSIFDRIVFIFLSLSISF